MRDAQRDGRLPLPAHARRLLESSARLLGAGIEILAPDGRASRTRRTPRLCLGCERETPETAGDCARVRRGQAGLAGLGATPLQWTCPHGASLTAWPVAAESSARATLICCRARGALRPAGDGIRPLGIAKATTTPPDDRGEARRQHFLRRLARQLGEAMAFADRVRDLRVQLAAKHDELRAFYAMAGQLSDSQDLAPTLRRVMEAARAAEEADVVLLWTNGRRHRDLLFRPGLERAEASDRRFWGALGGALHARLHANENGRYAAFLSGREPDLPSPFPPLQVLAVRLRLEESDGLLCLGRFDPDRAFQPAEALLLGSLAEQIRLALSNADLFEDLRVFLMATVKSLVGAIEEKDPYTSGHSERVHLISMLIGRQLGLTTAEMETLRWASILHDVGKIGLSEAILLKPGRLTAEEFQIVREHPDRGYRLLRPIRQLAEAAAIIRSHHEQIDGSGYPLGLKGDAIPRLARIIAVADTFDALTSTRAYRTARTLDYSLDEIRRVRGAQLDADAVDAFLRLESFLREHQVMIQASPEEARRKAA